MNPTGITRVILLGAWGVVALVVVAEVGRASIPDPLVPVMFTYACPRLEGQAARLPVTLTQRDRALNVADVLGPCVAQDPGDMDAVMRARAGGTPQ